MIWSQIDNGLLWPKKFISQQSNGSTYVVQEAEVGWIAVERSKGNRMRGLHGHTTAHACKRWCEERERGRQAKIQAAEDRRDGDR